MQTQTLIQTKLHPPTLSPDLLPRTRLVERLHNGRYRKLTLISAPAGYGKSVLAGIWQKACDCPVAWLSLDKNDNELGVFLSYVVEALRTILPNAYDNTRALLNGLQLPPLDVISIGLVNETAVLSQPFLLILDDYHLIHNPDIHQLIDSLIQYQSPYMHLVLITRQDPPLDISNLRAKNQITEIRLAELRFDETEAQKYLQINLDNNLPPDLALQLYKHTEGWAVGLRMAVLALRNQVDQDRFFKTYQGQNQYIMSYLIAEVLANQPQSVRRFLLQTSLLNRFCVPLCDAFLSFENQEHKPSSQEILDHLCRDNLFLVPLDHQGKWFRYNHLFQDLLRHQLKTAVSESEINQLHIRASSWFAQNSFFEEALDHAFAANDTEQAIQIVAQARYPLMNETEWQRLEQLLRRFPRDVIDQSPELFIAEMWLCYHRSQNTKLPIMLARLKQLIHKATITSESRNHFLGEISAIQSLLSYFDMDIENTRAHAEQALAQTPPELWIVRVFARMLLAGAQQMAGDLNRAYATLFRNFDEEFVQNNPFKATTLTISCNISWIAADLTTIQQQAAQALALCQDARSPEMQGNAHYHLGTVAYLQNDFASAEEHFSFVQQRPYATYGTSFVYCSCGLALIYQVQGKEQEARDIVDAALAFFLITGNTPLLMLMKAFQAELALQQGQLSTALQWAVQFDSIPPLTPMHRLYDPHFTLVRIWLAENTVNGRQKAADLLAHIKTFLEETHNNIFLIETLALQATIYHEEGNEAQAMSALEQALTLALPDNIMRPFINLGQGIGNLLYNLTVHEPELASFKTRILEAIAPLSEQPNSLANDNHDAQPLLEPLTDREMDVLSLLDQRQTDKEIAQKLHISPHTVRSHIKHIYTKLDVTNRRQAAMRAQELGLVTSD